jgi:hypothetical protein
LTEDPFSVALDKLRHDIFFYLFCARGVRLNANPVFYELTIISAADEDYFVFAFVEIVSDDNLVPISL